ncbi:MAG: hypothetical protein KJ621_09490 [Proteobacteria bacterium]|nr:hypothetical protein [Pseudomonadota bacterium]MBU1742504.1 hypothetical protein [Pseudomonadota bacterium]
MDQKQMLAQMIEFNKNAFENSFSATALMQDQMEKMTSTFLDQATWLPEDGKKVLKEWTETFKKGRTDFKKAVDDSFKKVDSYFAGKTKSE